MNRLTAYMGGACHAWALVTFAAGLAVRGFVLLGLGFAYLALPAGLRVVDEWLDGKIQDDFPEDDYR